MKHTVQNPDQKPIDNKLIVNKYESLVKKTKHSKGYLISRKLPLIFGCTEKVILEALKIQA